MVNPPPHPSGPQLPAMEIRPDLPVEYVNLVRIAHSPSELVFDFAHLLPGSGPAKVTARLVMSPLGAKLFYRALTENLARYEAAFGAIPIPGDPTLADNLFRPPAPPEKPGE
ncbi:MAG: hypothetical protein A2W35_17670 [Chloroflexi bacterium RBG_16_57_11]|nr:MAG: hypothetical protein A2W35_17670 [Chloroflexi bacterium RBG_16_57_11]